MSHPTTFRSELGALGLLLGPILVSQLSQAAFGFVDTVMAGQASPLDLAAVALGASIWLPLMLLSTGTLLATTPLVAAARGRGDHAEIPHIAHQALWLALAIGLLGAALLHFVDPVFHLLDTPAHLRDMTRRFLAAIAWGLPATALFAVLRNYCEGMGKPLPVTLVSIAGLLLLVPLNYVLIHGKFGLPRMGGVGCGVASAIVAWLMLLMLLAYVLKSPHFARVRLLHERSRLEPERLMAFLRLGVPIGIAIFFEVSVFAIVAILISPLGELQVAGHQIALSVTSLLFMFPLSFAFCMTIRVGHAYGRNDFAAIRHTRRVGLVALAAFATLSALFIVLTRDSLTALYSDDPAVRLLAADLLLFAAAYQVVDALQVGAAGSLRGLHDTRGPMVMTLVAYWLFALPLGYVLGLTFLTGERYGPYGFWAGLVVGLTVAAVLLNHRLARQLRRLESRPDRSTGTPAGRS
ncbi:MAG: multidrug resistance protein [Moraxellaceae bacterium]|jgi:MATE family multidrug resistance protein|nr:multidrug resistance protein [Moraxellaceae bacterium]